MKFRLILKATIFVLFVTLFLNNAAALAQTEIKDKKKRNAESEKKVTQTNTKILLDKIEITGKIEKPQTAFIIQGQEQAVEDIHIDRSFFREMFREIEREDMIKLSERRRAKRKNRK